MNSVSDAILDDCSHSDDCDNFDVDYDINNLNEIRNENLKQIHSNPKVSEAILRF